MQLAIQYRRLVLLAILLPMLLIGLIQAAGETIPRSIVSNGGGRNITSTLQLQASIGQPIAGTVSNGLHLCSGLICGTDAPNTPVATQSVYLPFVVR